mgnify:CR=1 FL=1
MIIAVLASEGAPYVKSGGLGDVMEALPGALSRMEGNEVVLILPYYKKIKDNPAIETELVREMDVELGWRHQYAGLERLCLPGLTVYLVDSEYYFGDKIYRGGEAEEIYNQVEGIHYSRVNGGIHRESGCEMAADKEHIEGFVECVCREIVIHSLV